MSAPEPAPEPTPERRGVDALLWLFQAASMEYYDEQSAALEDVLEAVLVLLAPSVQEQLKAAHEQYFYICVECGLDTRGACQCYADDPPRPVLTRPVVTVELPEVPDGPVPA